MTIGLVLASAATVHARQPATADKEQAARILDEIAATGDFVLVELD